MTVAQAEGSAVLTVPDDDVLADLVRHRERFTPEDMLAVAFNGLARRRMRGSMRPGEERWPHWRPTFGARRKLVSTFEGHQWAVPSADAEKAKASAASSVPNSVSRWAAWVSNPAPWD